MQKKTIHTFFLSIVIPSILAIGLFILSIFTIILPTFENNIMEKKKEMISELTNTAWSLIREYDQDYQEQLFTLEEAQEIAASRIEQIRYGKEGKDYFWIIDTFPTMVMHPYRHEMIHEALDDYQDPNGKRLFVEAVSVVKKSDHGFIDYMWQWKDDSSRIVPKLSYVKAYHPWGWIVGTGIYLEDVKVEIKDLQHKVIKVSLFITLLISAIILYVIRQSLNIENKRLDAEKKLMLSRQKYKSLVEASTEGTMLILGTQIIFANLKFAELSGYAADSIPQMNFADIFNTNWNQVTGYFGDPQKSISKEVQIRCADNTIKEVIISVSKIKYSGNDGFIVIVKEISRQKIIENETESLTQELQTSLLLMNQPVKHIISDIVRCDINTTIQEASVLMEKKNKNILFVQNENNIIGVVNNSDLTKRVLAKNIDTSQPIISVMTSPVITILDNALLYEAILEIKNRNISHLGVTNIQGEMIGVISCEDISGTQQNSVSYLIKEIEYAQSIEQLKKIHHKLPVLVNALVESGDKTQNITKIITSVSDAIIQQIIMLAIEEIGEAPCKFAYMVMGSEGREEQTLSTDQDNAIVFEDVEDNEREKAYKYFQKLGSVVSKNLDNVGYKFCVGEIMASNPKWSQPLSVWKDYFTDWLNTSEPQSILDASIFFDFRCVFGHSDFVDGLHDHVSTSIENKPVFFYNLAQSIVKFKPPLSLFGNIVGNERGGKRVDLDIKKILLPVISFIRLYALYSGIMETNSLQRAKQLFILEVIPKSMYNELVLSYSYLMQLRFRFQTYEYMQNTTPDNIIDLNKLTHIEISTLKKIFNEIGNLQTKINFDFKGNQ